MLEFWSTSSDWFRLAIIFIPITVVTITFSMSLLAEGVSETDYELYSKLYEGPEENTSTCKVEDVVGVDKDLIKGAEKMINKVKLLERHAIDTQNAVFVSFITEEETVPSIGMIMRTDGSFGFVGGKVDEGETLEQALVREVLEEVGYPISLSKIVPLTSHTIKGDSSTLHTHHYTCHVPTHELLRLQKNQAKGELHNREVAGFCIVPTIPVSVDNLLKLPFAGTAKEELISLLKYINIF